MSGVVAAGECKCLKNLVVGEGGLCLDLYLPSSSSPQGSSKLLVFVHGGAWRTGDKGDFEFLGMQFAQMGVACAIPSYRLSNTPENIRHPSHIEDIARAVTWLLAEEQLDLWRQSTSQPQLFLVGHSAGAQISAMLAMSQEWLRGSVWECIKGVVGVEGIYDIPLMISAFPSYIDFVEQAFTLDKEIWKAASPQYCCSKRPLPSFLILFSLEDELLDLPQSTNFLAHLQSQPLSANVRPPQLRTDMVGKHDDMLRAQEFFKAVMDFFGN